MLNTNLNLAIRKYLEEKKFVESLKCMNNTNEIKIDSLNDLSEIFRKSYDKNSAPQKLSFSYNVNNSQSLLKRKLSQMNANEPKKKKQAEKVKKKKMPESFLLLMNELCIDKKDAKFFYENPTQWSYIKSDRKIYCAKQGNHYYFFYKRLGESGVYKRF